MYIELNNPQYYHSYWILGEVDEKVSGGTISLYAGVHVLAMENRANETVRPYRNTVRSLFALVSVQHILLNRSA